MQNFRFLGGKMSQLCQEKVKILTHGRGFWRTAELHVIIQLYVDKITVLDHLKTAVKYVYLLCFYMI